MPGESRCPHGETPSFFADFRRYLGYILSEEPPDGRRGADVTKPLYGLGDVHGVMKCFEDVEYGMRFSPLPGLEVEYRDAGHIFGSTTTMLSITEGSHSVRLGCG